MRRPAQLFALGLAAVLLVPGSASAGNGNTLYLTQDGTYPGAAANNIIIDQSAGTYTSVGNSLMPATQRGGANQATLTLTGNCTLYLPNCGTVSLDQDNSSEALLAIAPTITVPQGNVANVSISGTGNASVTQIGDNNEAHLAVDDGHGLISQQGLNNIAKLQIQGDLTGSITQIGDTNVGDLLIYGAPGSSVSLTQTGSNQTYVGGGSANSTTPMTVFTTTSGVTISQTSF